MHRFYPPCLATTKGASAPCFALTQSTGYSVPPPINLAHEAMPSSPSLDHGCEIKGCCCYEFQVHDNDLIDPYCTYISFSMKGSPGSV